MYLVTTFQCGETTSNIYTNKTIINKMLKEYEMFLEGQTDFKMEEGSFSEISKKMKKVKPKSESHFRFVNRTTLGGYGSDEIMISIEYSKPNSFLIR